MTYQRITRPAKEFKQILAATIGDYRKRDVSIVVCESFTVSDLNWSGGTRSQYRACSPNGNFAGSLDRFNHMAPWDNVAEGKSLPTVPGVLVVRSGHFCGKTSQATIYVHPSDMPKLLTS